MMPIQGIPASSIAWGPWKSIGMATDPALLHRMEKSGMFTLTPEQGLVILSNAMRQAVPMIKMLGGRFKSLLEEDMEAQQLVMKPSAVTKDRHANHSVKYDRAFIKTQLQTTVETFLGHRMDASASLATDLDSIQSVSLVDNISSAVGMDLSVTILYDYPTFEDLTEYIFTQLELRGLVDSELKQKPDTIVTVSEKTASPDAQHSEVAVADVNNKSFLELSKYGMYCYPSPEHMSTMSDRELASVENFIVGRENVGEIRFMYPVDLRSVDLARSVTIRKGHIEIVGSHSAAPGEGLNQPAILVFKGASKRLFASKVSRRVLLSRIRRACDRMGAILVHVDEELAEWMVKVDFF